MKNVPSWPQIGNYYPLKVYTRRNFYGILNVVQKPQTTLLENTVCSSRFIGLIRPAEGNKNAGSVQFRQIYASCL